MGNVKNEGYTSSHARNKVVLDATKKNPFTMSLKIHWLYPFSQKLFFVLLDLIFCMNLFHSLAGG